MKSICQDCWKSMSCFKKATGKLCKRIPKQPKPIDTLSTWEWETLVAAWRYYEHGHSITAVSFPDEIIGRFWASGKYSEKVKDRIARQFADVDHKLRGEQDWASPNDSSVFANDGIPWCKFYAFCKAWTFNAFKTITLEGDSNGKHIQDEVKAFYCERTKRWYPMNKYVAAPHMECWCEPSFIKEIR